MNLSRATTVALDAAAEAEAILLRHRNRRLRITGKRNRDFVTNADLASEAALLARLRGAFPDHAVYAEESGLTTAAGTVANPTAKDLAAPEWLWVVDPLDGTINFAHGSDHFNVTLALLHRGERVLGIVRCPVLDETYVARRGRGATRNGRRLRIAEKRLRDALFLSYVSAHYDEAETRRALGMVGALLTRCHGWRDFGNGAADLAQVARGSVDFLVTMKCDAFSFTASALLVEEAGGVVRDFAGRPWGVTSKDLVAGPARLVGEVRRIVNGALRRR